MARRAFPRSPVPRKISIEIARSLAEFPLSQAAADGNDASFGQGENAAGLQAARMQRARNRRPSYHPQATKPMPSTKLSAGANASATGHVNNNSATSTSGTSRAEQVGAGSRAGHDEVLRKLGGGFLTVTALCTLNRALLLYTEKRTAENSQKPPHDGRPPDNDVDGQFEPAREVAELLSLLAALFRLGSPSSQVRERRRLPPTFSSVRLASGSLAFCLYPSLCRGGLRRLDCPPFLLYQLVTSFLVLFAQIVKLC